MINVDMWDEKQFVEMVNKSYSYNFERSTPVVCYQETNWMGILMTFSSHSINSILVI